MKFVNIGEFEKSKEAKKYEGKETRLVLNSKVAKTAEKGFKITDVEVGEDLILMVETEKKVVKKAIKKKVVKKAAKTSGRKK